MSRYTKEHYEDVASLILGATLYAHPEHIDRHALVTRLADLFAADNPDSVYCGYCGATEPGQQAPVTSICVERGTEAHSFVYHKGFDREWFLAACGLEPTCSLCGKPSPEGDVHKECADYEQALADAQGESQENLEAAEEIYDRVVEEQVHDDVVPADDASEVIEPPHRYG